MALRRELDRRTKENFELRRALLETTKQLAEAAEELKVLALPFFRRWRLRRLFARRQRALETLRRPLPGLSQTPLAENEMCPDGIVRAKEQRMERVPLIVVPGRG